MPAVIYVRRKGRSTRAVRVDERRRFRALKQVILRLAALGEPHHAIAKRLDISKTYLDRVIAKGVWA
jgi:hypothetical protein